MGVGGGLARETNNPLGFSGSGNVGNSAFDMEMVPVLLSIFFFALAIARGYINIFCCCVHFYL